MPSPASLMSKASSAASAGLSPASVPPYALAMRFKVSVSGISLGSWSACKGLKVQFETTPVTSGGDYSGDRILPKQLKYSNITLERAVHPTESQTVKTWLEQAVSSWMNYNGSGDPYAGDTAKITLLGAQGQEVMSWNLIGVYPASWTGPSLSATDNKVAIETLELVHQGFLLTD
jgi:phage tail-like protein